MLKGLDKLKKIHFVGIGGAGMSALAKILLEMGFDVSGSDKSSGDATKTLAAAGATIFTGGHNAENVKGADAIVVSSAIPFDNPEVLAAYDLKIPKLHRSDVNAALLNDKKGIAVAGAHGKTTTTSMLGVMLKALNLSPTVIIGGQSPDLGTNALLGKGDYLVSEADESDGSFLKLNPYIAVVTNVENDHLDHYGTMDNIRSAFAEFIGNVKEGGFAVLCFDSENLLEIAKTTKTRYYSYAIDADADYKAANIEMNGKGTAFDVMRGDENLGRVTINIPGRHNILDAMAAIVTGLQMGQSISDMAKALKNFHGAKRRFETKGRTKQGVWVVDDYGHHPTEITATLEAAKETKPKRLICVFQPHRYSRTKLLHTEFGTAFDAADVLILTDVYSAGEEPIPGIDGTTILYDVKNFTGKSPVYVEKREDIAPYLADMVEDGDMVITMGAGDIYKTGEELVKILGERV